MSIRLHARRNSVDVRRNSIDWACVAEGDDETALKDPIYQELKSYEKRAEQILQQLREAQKSLSIDNVDSFEGYRELRKRFRKLQKEFQEKEKSGYFTNAQATYFSNLVLNFQHHYPCRKKEIRKIKKKSCVIL